ncbi:hypothetical protein M0R04_12835 [Candidatus Dojkabacteria bacterium]|jgi:hypothetical protein|nr:hypothetical protein [Candidatus Dojkabacteria bacterium]
MNNISVISGRQPTKNYGVSIEASDGFSIPNYDVITLTYVAAGNGVDELETVVYKKNSVTVATLTLAYDSNNKLVSVTKS